MVGRNFLLIRAGSRRLFQFVLPGLLLACACGIQGESAQQQDDGGAVPQLSGNFAERIPFSMGSTVEATKEWIKGGAHTSPEAALPIEPRSAADYADPPASGLRVTWLGHSSSLVELDGARILVDPVWAERASPFSFMGPKRFYPPPLPLEDLPPLDLVLVSHDHYDHLDKDAVIQLSAVGNRFLVPLGIKALLEDWGVPAGQVTEVDWWQEHMVAGLRITATPARHFSGRSIIMADRNKRLWCGFTLHGAEHSLYYSGDTGMFDGFAEIGERLGPFDLAMIEIGAYHRLWADIHIGPEQAVQAAQLSRSRLLLPVHWATFDLAMHGWTEPGERLLVAAATAGLNLALPLPGQRVEPGLSVPDSIWWPDQPWQTAEDSPLVSSPVRRPGP
jgi:L-ascorbate metabolism protein UlaG (beta-lactamase superfamily)